MNYYKFQTSSKSQNNVDADSGIQIIQLSQLIILEQICKEILFDERATSFMHKKVDQEFGG